MNLCFSGDLPCFTLCYTCVSNGEYMDDDDDALSSLYGKLFDNVVHADVQLQQADNK